MLLQTNSYVVPKEKRNEHARLVRRFRQSLAKLGCEHFEVYEQVSQNWAGQDAGGRFVQIMRFRDRRHQLEVQAAERTDPAAQALIQEFCELINFPFQQQQGLFAVGFYNSILPAPSSSRAADAPGEEPAPVVDGEDAAADSPPPSPFPDTSAPVPAIPPFVKRTVERETAVSEVSVADESSGSVFSERSGSGPASKPTAPLAGLGSADDDADVELMDPPDSYPMCPLQAPSSGAPSVDVQTAMASEVSTPAASAVFLEEQDVLALAENAYLPDVPEESRDTQKPANARDASALAEHADLQLLEASGSAPRPPNELEGHADEAMRTGWQRWLRSSSGGFNHTPKPGDRLEGLAAEPVADVSASTAPAGDISASTELAELQISGGSNDTPKPHDKLEGRATEPAEDVRTSMEPADLRIAGRSNDTLKPDDHLEGHAEEPTGAHEILLGKAEHGDEEGSDHTPLPADHLQPLSEQSVPEQDDPAPAEQDLKLSEELKQASEGVEQTRGPHDKLEEHATEPADAQGVPVLAEHADSPHSESSDDNPEPQAELEAHTKATADAQDFPAPTENAESLFIREPTDPPVPEDHFQEHVPPAPRRWLAWLRFSIR